MRYVVQVAHVFGLVTQAIGVKIRFGLHAADEEFIAHAFAHVDGNARRVADCIGKRLCILVAKDGFGYHMDRTWNVDKRCFGKGCRRGIRYQVWRHPPAAHVDLWQTGAAAGVRIIRFGSCLRVLLGGCGCSTRQPWHQGASQVCGKAYKAQFFHEHGHSPGLVELTEADACSACACRLECRRDSQGREACLRGSRLVSGSRPRPAAARTQERAMLGVRLNAQHRPTA